MSMTLPCSVLGASGLDFEMPSFSGRMARVISLPSSASSPLVAMISGWSLGCLFWLCQFGRCGALCLRRGGQQFGCLMARADDFVEDAVVEPFAEFVGFWRGGHIGEFGGMLWARWWFAGGDFGGLFDWVHACALA
jgi:hypothetical protein